MAKKNPSKKTAQKGKKLKDLGLSKSELDRVKGGALPRSFALIEGR